VEIESVKDMIFRHAEYTGSRRAAAIILGWDDFVSRIVRVMPNDYRRVLDTQAEIKDADLNAEELAMAVFEINSKAIAQATGK
jgi:glutamate synthase (NADPH) large chain